MPKKPPYIQDLIAQGKVHAELLANLRHESDDLWKQSDLVRDAVADIRRDVAVMNQRLENLANEVKKWDGRWWYLICGFIASLVALASSLIVALVTPASK